MNQAEQSRRQLTGHRPWLWLVAAAIGAAVCVAGALVNPQRLMAAWLFAFLYWWLAGAGCLGLSLLYHMTGGQWGRAARPFFEAGTWTLPVTTLAFLPLVWGLDYVYAWTQTGFFTGLPHAENRQWYLRTPFFLGRSAGYLAAGLLLAVPFTRTRVNSQTGSQTGSGTGSEFPSAGAGTRRRPWSGAAAVLLVLVVSFAAMDWGMSLDPEWYSTLYGGLFIADGLLTALCLSAAGVAWWCWKLKRRDERAQTILHDLGKLLLAFLMVWAYFEFSQFLIIYAGNLPVEAGWYTRRLSDGWQWLALAMLLLHFVLPFFLLLSRDIKHDPRALACIAAGLALIHTIDVYWTIMPSLLQGGPSISVLDIGAFVAIGGVWMFQFRRQLTRRLERELERWPHSAALALPAAGAPNQASAPLESES